jgi:hypothetical protein
MRSNIRQDLIAPGWHGRFLASDPSMEIEKTRLGRRSSPTHAFASIYSSATSLTPITPSQTRHVSGTTQPLGTPKRDISHVPADLVHKETVSVSLLDRMRR